MVTTVCQPYWDTLYVHIHFHPFHLHLDAGDGVTAEQARVGLSDVTAEDAHPQRLQPPLQPVPGAGGGAALVSLQSRLGERHISLSHGESELDGAWVCACVRSLFPESD